MHTAIRIANFRSIRNAVFYVKNGLNVLVGPNGSGKTNILQALKFLSLLQTNGAAVAMGRSGGPARNFRRGESEITFRIAAAYEEALFRGKQTKFLVRWEVAISLSEEEKLVNISREIVTVFPADNQDDVVLRIEVTRSAGSTRSKVIMADETLLTKKMFNSPAGHSTAMKKADLFAAVRKEINERLGQMKKSPPDASFLAYVSWLHQSIGRILRDISSFNEYNIQPDLARQATDPLPLTRMGNDGQGVSEVINALESEQFHRLAGPYRVRFGGFGDPYYAASGGIVPFGGIHSISRSNALESITEHLRAAVSSIDAIGTEIDPSSGRRFVVFKSGANKFRPEEISDGTIKWLCLLVAMYVPSSRVVLLEEPENYMHPWMQQRFIGLVRDQAKKQGMSVIISTHSVTVLNSIGLKELTLVRFDNGETLIEAVKDQEQLQAALNETSFGLGDVWVSGGIDGASEGSR